MKVPMTLTVPERTDPYRFWRFQSFYDPEKVTDGRKRSCKRSGTPYNHIMQCLEVHERSMRVLEKCLKTLRNGQKLSLNVERLGLLDDRKRSCCTRQTVQNVWKIMASFKIERSTVHDYRFFQCQFSYKRVLEVFKPLTINY
jgi:hypothetical protein